MEHRRFIASSRRAVTGRRNRLRSCHASCANKPERPLILAGGPGDAGPVSRDGAGPAAAVSAPGPRGKIVPSRDDLRKAADGDGRGRPRRQAGASAWVAAGVGGRACDTMVTRHGRAESRRHLRGRSTGCHGGRRNFCTAGRRAARPGQNQITAAPRHSGFNRRFAGTKSLREQYEHFGHLRQAHARWRSAAGLVRCAYALNDKRGGRLVEGSRGADSAGGSLRRVPRRPSPVAAP